MKALRLTSALVALAAVLLQLGQHIGWSLVGCSSGCEVVRDWPGSLAIEFLAVGLASAMLGATLANKTRLTSTLGWAALLGSLFSVVAMRFLGAYCPVCGFADAALVTFFFASRSHKGWNSVAMPVALFGFVAAGWMLFEEGTRVPEAHFALRAYEQAPNLRQGPVLLFSDPECPHCRDLMAKLARVGDGLGGRVFYRWMLRPATSDRTLWAAVAIESLLRKDAKLGQQYRISVYAERGPLSKRRLIELAPDSQSRDLVEESLKHPDDAVLAWIKEDGDLAASLQIAEVPAYCGLVPGQKEREIVLTRLPEDTFLSSTIEFPGGTATGVGGDH